MLKFDRVLFVKAIMRSGVFADLRLLKKTSRALAKTPNLLALWQKTLARSFG